MHKKGNHAHMHHELYVDIQILRENINLERGGDIQSMKQLCELQKVMYHQCLRVCQLTEKFWILHHFSKLRIQINHAAKLWIEIQHLKLTKQY